jgi:glutathione synthase/RimK-type ligase-like ATP-grasp enzyme
LAAMRRDIISGDIRTNASLGAETSTIELTELEIRDSLKVAELVKGELVGVDFLPSKNREKEQPYMLEVNSMPGFSGIERTMKNKSVTSDFLKYYLNRDNWS